MERRRAVGRGGPGEADVPGAASKPLASKLPAWLTAAKHREEVLRHLDQLRRTLGS